MGFENTEARMIAKQGSECVNLATRFGRRFRIRFEEGYNAKSIPRRCRDPWLMIIPCQAGHIGPWSADRLVASTRTRGPNIAKLLAVPTAKMEQDGSDGANISFHVDQFRAVAKIMHPRVRRVLTAEQKAALAARGRLVLGAVNAVRRRKTSVDASKPT
jgi:hypothetical protein